MSLKFNLTMFVRYVILLKNSCFEELYAVETTGVARITNKLFPRKIFERSVETAYSTGIMKCYEGDNPYIFISYAHKDKEQVAPFIGELMNRGYRIWYDDGINPSEEWPESVATHLYHATSVVFFISKAFCTSKNCKRELNFAIDKDKDMFAIFFDNTDLSLGMQMQLGTIQSIIYNESEDITNIINKMIVNDVLAKPNLTMSKEEFVDFFDIKVVPNAMINQMAITVGIVQYDNHVLMVKRRKEENNLSWGFPATMLKPQDDIAKRIVKETFSETGIKTDFVSLIGTRIHPDTKTVTYYCALKYIKGEIENYDEDENAAVQWVPVKTYRDFITSNLFIKVKEYLEDKNG